LLCFGIGLKCLVAVCRQDGYRGTLRQLTIELDPTVDDLA
jgi:hypothetical protein